MKIEKHLQAIEIQNKKENATNSSICEKKNWNTISSHKLSETYLFDLKF